MQRLFKYIGYTLFLPFWWLQLLIPRRKDIWVFGAWHGRRYSDNSMYLFEFVNAKDAEINAIWITKSRVVCEYVRSLGYKSFMAHSLLGIYYCLQAKYIIVSSVKKDVNHLFINGAKTVQLWHGNPMKKIGMDDKYSASNTLFIQILVKYLFSMAYEFNYDYVVSNAACFSKKMSSAFNISQAKILETGCPRNDIFFSKKMAPANKEIRQKFKGCKLVYYLPTFRNKGKKQSLLELDSYNERELQEFLERENMVFITKAHFATKPLKSGETINDRIYHLPDDDLVDINFLLKDSDILITDYSGAYFDFLLTQKPIIFAAFDLEEYLASSREMYFEYKDVVAGPIVETWEDLFSKLRNIENLTEYEFPLAEKNSLFNKFHDDNNSQRVYEYLKNLAK